ncbi:MAG: FAD-dependent oxidoreductase [Methylophilus sp.]
MSQQIQTDVVIVGAGLVGLTAAIALSKQHKKVVLIDSQVSSKAEFSGWDQRIYALTESSVIWLKSLGVWVEVDIKRVNSIQAMQLWGPDSVHALTLNADEAYLSQMGCILENQNLVKACWQVLDRLEITVLTGVACQSISHSDQEVSLILDDGCVVTAKLLIAADGSDSWVRQQANISVNFKSFDQTAIVANFETEIDHQNIARQWFGAHETLALLPLPKKNVSMVWAMPTTDVDELLSLSNVTLAERVESRTHAILGKLKPLNKAIPFVLNQKTASQLVANRIVLMGDAAHQVHPMAGQGVNLGFGDVMKLSELTANLSALHDMGDYTLLRQYERARKLDILQMNQLTAGLDTLFSVDHSWVPKLTEWGMQLIDKQNVIKKHLIRHATL